MLSKLRDRQLLDAKKCYQNKKSRLGTGDACLAFRRLYQKLLLISQDKSTSWVYAATAAYWPIRTRALVRRYRRSAACLQADP